jgi:thioredoxin-like negative regulator of GroEL
MGEADEIQALLRKLEQAPNDFELRGRAADALDAAGRRDEALATLAPLVNVTGHDDDAGLPCLCKTCFARAGETAEAAGMTFRRSFAVARNRVLHFWTPRDLDRPAVRRSVAEALHERLTPRKAAR